MPLIISLKEQQHFYLGDEKIRLDRISRDYASAVVCNEGDEHYTIEMDRMTEVVPGVFVSLGRRAARGARTVSLVIDAPATVSVGRSPGPEAVFDPTFRRFRPTAYALSRAKSVGVEKPQSEVSRMARFATPYTHARWNRRYGEYLFQIEGDLVLDVSRAQKQVRPRRRSRPLLPWAVRCTICRGSRSVLVVQKHEDCLGKGCPGCADGEIWVEKNCIAYARDSEPVCSDFINGDQK